MTSMSNVEDRPKGCLTVEIVKGNNMPNMDVGSLSDCYCIVSLWNATKESKVAQASLVTLSQDDDLDPIWKAFRSFPVTPEDTDLLKVEVYDEDYLTADDSIGVAFFKLETLRGCVRHRVVPPCSHCSP